MAKRVREYMHRGLITCRADSTLGQVAVIMFQNHVHALVVVDRDGRHLGLITDFDLMAGEWLSADKESLDIMRKMTAGDLMSTPMDTIDSDASVKEAAREMREKVIRRLVVTENDKPVGLISVSDLVASMAEAERIRRETVADVMSDAYLVCRGKTPVAAVARAMTSTRWRSVLVVNAHGKALGVVSGLDLLAYCDVDDCKEKTVADIMHPVLVINMNATLREAADMMIENHHHRLLVVDPDEPDSMPLGIISSFDIVAEMARPDSIWQKK